MEQNGGYFLCFWTFTRMMNAEIIINYTLSNHYTISCIGTENESQEILAVEKKFLFLVNVFRKIINEIHSDHCKNKLISEWLTISLFLDVFIKYQTQKKYRIISFVASIQFCIKGQKMEPNKF